MSPLGRCVMQAELRKSSSEEEIKQLENKKKRLIQEQKEQERKDRTNRLCKRMGFIEKLLPDTISLTEEQFKSFVEQTIATEHSRRILDGWTAQNAATAPAQGAGFAERGRGCYSPRPRWKAGVRGGVSIGSGNFVLINYLPLKGRVIQRVLLVKCIEICFSIMRIIDRKSHMIYINAIKRGNYAFPFSQCGYLIVI